MGLEFNCEAEITVSSQKHYGDEVFGKTIANVQLNLSDLNLYCITLQLLYLSKINPDQLCIKISVNLHLMIFSGLSAAQTIHCFHGDRDCVATSEFLNGEGFYNSQPCSCC